MKYLLNLVALGVLVLIVLGLMKFKDSDTYYSWQHRAADITESATDFIKVRKHNIAIETSSQRKRPLTFIEQESMLESYMPDVFGRFNPRQWANFWSLIYDPISVGTGPFAKKDYRTKEQVEEILRGRYPNAFNFFQETHWHDFWSIARVRWQDE